LAYVAGGNARRTLIWKAVGKCPDARRPNFFGMRRTYWYTAVTKNEDNPPEADRWAFSNSLLAGEMQPGYDRLALFDKLVVQIAR